MAFSTTAAAAQFVKKGALGISGLYTTRRKYSLDTFGDNVLYQSRYLAMFDKALYSLGQVVPVDDAQPKFLSKNEAPIKIAIGASAATTTYEYDTLFVAKADSRFIQPGNSLVVPQVFAKSDGTLFSTTKYASGYSPETVRVIAVEAFDATNDKIIVRRGHGLNTSASGAGVVTQLTTSHHLVKMPVGLVDGGDAAISYDWEAFETQNNCEMFSKTWEMTRAQMKMNVYGKETETEKGAQARNDFFREQEFKLFWGMKGAPTVDGALQLLTGGVVEFIPRTGGLNTPIDGVDKVIDFGGAWTLERQREIDQITFKYCGTKNMERRKDRFCGSGYLTKVWNYLEDRLTVNDAFSELYGWRVVELNLGHGAVMLHEHPMFVEMHSTGTPYENDYIQVDMNYLKIMEFLPTQVRQIKTLDGNTDNRSHKAEWEIFAQIGLWRGFPDAHAAVYGITG